MANTFELLPAIPGHSHSIGADGRPTCGCTMRPMPTTTEMSKLEPPDFDHLATQLLNELPDAFLYRGAGLSSAIPGVEKVLRQVWNAGYEVGYRKGQSSREADIDAWTRS